MHAHSTQKRKGMRCEWIKEIDKLFYGHPFFYDHFTLCVSIYFPTWIPLLLFYDDSWDYYISLSQQQQQWELNDNPSNRDRKSEMKEIEIE
jgi:hypothetical protein